MRRVKSSNLLVRQIHKASKDKQQKLYLNNLGEEFVPRRDPDPRYIFSEASWKILSEKIKHTSNDI
jgi:hypothetical protein